MALAVKSLVALTACFASHSFATLVARTNGPTAPPCGVPFTPYLYAGCYNDPQSPRALPFSPVGLNRQNMTIETCVAVCKGNNFRYAGIEYYGECYCGDSVQGTLAADNACTFPCTGNKTETCGGNKLLSVYMDPTYPSSDQSDILDYTPEGCYTEGYNGHAVGFRQDQVNSTTMTTESCLRACKSQNFPLAATEYGGECYCGVVLGNGTASAPNSDCSMKCNGNPNEICGGRSRLNLYVASDLMSTEPCSPFVLPPPIVRSSTTTSKTSTQSLSMVSTVSTTSSAASTTSLTTSSASASITTTSSAAPDTTTTSTFQTSTSQTTASPESSSETSTYDTTTSSSSSSSSSIVDSSTSQITTPESTTSSTAAATTDSFSTSQITTAESTTSSTAAATTSTVDASSSSTTTSAPDIPSTTSSSTSSLIPDSPTTTSQSSTSESTTSQSTTPQSTTPQSTTSQSTTPQSTTPQSTTPQSTTSQSTTSQSTTSQSTTSQSTTSQSSTSQTTTSQLPTTKPSTTSNPTTSPTLTTSKTSTSSSKCTSTVISTPTCEYGCGKWCSRPVPVFSDHPTCKNAVAECILQIADCFLSAGWPASLQCARYQSWCQSISSYCGTTCLGGKCSKNDCVSKNPPIGGQSATTSTTVNACPATKSSASTTSTSSTAPVPTVSSICVVPKGPKDSGYEDDNCVGDIEPPVLTCNNLAKDFAQFPLKLYTSKDSTQCSGYSRSNVPQACKDACMAQYNSCVGTYATGCQGQKQNKDHDSYDSAKSKCSNQYNDCISVNTGNTAGSRCSSFGNGWD